ncbi:PTS sugar transporter [Enterococcus faecium]|nr:PTS sugar transporter [Enterococcus faecium]
MIVLTRVDHPMNASEKEIFNQRIIRNFCILIANDDVPTNEIRKTTIKLAKPQGVKLVIKSIDDSIAALKSGVTDKYKLFIVVESIEDAYKLAEAYPEIKTMIKAKPGTRSIGKAVNILPEEEERLKRLIDKQIEVEIRQVPADKKVDVREVL